MSLDEEVAALKRIPLFAKIDTSRLKLMAFASERMIFKPGQTLCVQGDPGDAAYIILNGSAEVLIKIDGGELAVADLGVNDIVGEIAILIDIPRTATVRATEEVTSLRLTKELFFRMVTDFPEIGVEVMRVLAQRLEATNARLRAANA